MGRWLIENKQGLAVRMGHLKDFNCRSYLIHKLFGVPPWITIWPWINYLSSILDNLAIFIKQNKFPVFFINEIWNVNWPALAFLQKGCSPSHNQRLCASLFAWKQHLSWYWIIIHRCPSWSSGIIFFNSGPLCFAIWASKRAIAGRKILFQYSTTSSCSWPSI